MKSILFAALMTMALSANATGNNDCPGNSCHGGEGGAGGNASAIGVGIGVGYANSASNSVATGGNANATGGAATALGGNSNVDVRNSSTNLNTNANTNVNTSSNVQGQVQGQGQKQSTNNANNSTNSVVVQGDNFEARRIPVNTAFAPSIAPTANCALSVSGGMSFVGFSGSFGKAYIDENCAALERVRAVSLVLGDKETAEALMCLDAKYAKARANAGRACPVEQE